MTLLQIIFEVGQRFLAPLSPLSPVCLLTIGNVVMDIVYYDPHITYHFITTITFDIESSIIYLPF